MTFDGAGTAGDWTAAEMLIREYAMSLGISLEFQRFDEEIQNLPREYGPPAGAFLLARENGEVLGGGGLRRFSDDACEMKRLYVRPSAQGRGVGRTIAHALIEQARGIGYQRMLLDTLPSMHEARALYRSLGFLEIAPYRFNPIPGTAYMELKL